MKTICVVSSQVKNIYSVPGLYTDFLLNSLKTNGYNVILLTLKDQLPSAENNFRGYSVSPHPTIKNLARWIPNSMAYSKKIRQIEQENTIDLFHFTDFRDGLFCQTTKPKIANINDTYTFEQQPLIYYKNNYQDYYKRALFYSLSRLIEKRLIDKYSCLLANSYFTMTTFISQLPSLENKTFVVHKSAIQPNYDLKTAILHNISHPFQRILFVGGNMQRKGLNTLIDALGILYSDFPKCELWIVGDDPQIHFFKDKAKKMHLQDNIKFLGHKTHEELLEIYSNCTVFSLPSLTEAFGVVILEAMSAGIPVITTDVGGIP